MAGMRKAKQYDWKDSNLALFGSDTERNIKKQSAETEPAFRGAGAKVGLQIWRIVKFKVEHWPKEDYGKFYEGDSYIILNTYKAGGSDALLYDVHFWIGKYSTQDEYGAAAYKTVELDTLLNDVPVQHREVQYHESALFKSYFSTIELWKGGADSGFRHVPVESYKPKLLHFHGDRYDRITIKEIDRCADLLDSTDVYILDLGLRIIQWNGSGSNKDERIQAAKYLQQVVDQRNGKPKKEVLDENCDDGEFKQHLDEVADVDDNDKDKSPIDKTKQLFRLSDASGKMDFSLEKSGSVSKHDLDTKDVFILDTKTELFVWVGDQTSGNEKRNAMSYAHKYLQSTDHPFVPVSCLKEGSVVHAFETALAA